jgi:hypothetical protein
MGANFLVVVATLAFQNPQQDTATVSISHGFGFERITDLVQYNRVQGLSFGLGYGVSVPGTRPIGLYGTVRYGLSDDRITGRFTLLGDSGPTRFWLSAYSDIADLDPFSPGRTFGNTLNGLLAGHDNADYALVQGGSGNLETSVAVALRLLVSARIERQSTVNQVAQSELNDFLGGTGLFPPNPPVDEGTFAATAVSLSHGGAIRWRLTADVLGGAGRTTGRLFGDVWRTIGSGLGATLRLRAGAATEPTHRQALFRLGGLNTVRGFEYGTLRAPTFWAVQLDVTPFGGRMRPVVFLDAGQAARMQDLFSSSALVGGGVGISLFSGFVRFDLSRPMSPSQGGKVRLDLVIQGLR